MSGIAPCLWFPGTAEEAARFYVSVFPGSRIEGISYYSEGLPMPAGSVLLVSFVLNGQPFQAMNGPSSFAFSDAVSFSVPCADQAEVDRFWDALTADGGEPRVCGWLKDRFGVSWQVVPEAVVRMQKQGSREQIERMMAVLVGMTKLDVAALEAAYAGV